LSSERFGAWRAADISDG